MTPFRAVLFFVIAVLLIPVLVYPDSLPTASPVTRMRPYAGIGVLLLPMASLGPDEPFGRLRLHDEPSMSRLENAELAKAPRHQWIFAMDEETLPLLVMARKADWLKVTYDDAGREGWIKPGQRHGFEAWEDFWVGRVVRLLPGLQKRHYQYYGQPAREPLADVTPQQLFRVIQVDNDWVRVQGDRNFSGWLRWQDEDGRLLIGLEQRGASRKQL